LWGIKLPSNSSIEVSVETKTTTLSTAFSSGAKSRHVGLRGNFYSKQDEKWALSAVNKWD